jgi:hypothetical protein
MREKRSKGRKVLQRGILQQVLKEKKKKRFLNDLQQKFGTK